METKIRGLPNAYDLMYPITENLRYIHIPQNKENYNEIMKLHFDIITMMEKAKQNLVK